MTMKTERLIKLGVPAGRPLELAKRAVASARRAKWDVPAIHDAVVRLLADPAPFVGHEFFGLLAAELVERRAGHNAFTPRDTPAPYRQWGRDLDAESIRQMENACRLPVTIAGALMPDAHVGYGLPIGGVLATRDAVIPYGVGVDIACRMKMTVLDLPPDALRTQTDRLVQALERETRFGIGSTFSPPRQHPVMDENWTVSPVTRRHKDKAWSQLGTSGSGNHFVEFGLLQVFSRDAGIEPGTYVALLSHSGSRGTGAEVCQYYSRLARERAHGLPKELQHLAWLDLTTHEGQEYWAAMELMGLYAAANHALIHHHVARALAADVVLDVENHHNFAWKERHFGETVVVHRKGATPAAEGTLGIIPGSMASPAYLVRGRGNPMALNSAAHGAGRRMSRKQAHASFNWPALKQLLAERNVLLLSAGLDESPMAYKDIDQVMAAQEDLVEPLARFEPRIVKMARAGERPED